MFEEQTFDSVLKRMKNGVESGIDIREGSVMHNALAPAALELSYLYDLLKIILRETYADTASREYLILRAAEKGLSPNPATYAEIKARIAGLTLNTVNVIGARFACDSVFYTVIEVIDGEDDTYRLKCETAGTVGNIPAGYLSNEDYVNGVETAEIVSILTYGEDEEETEAFRKRYMESLTSTPFAGNISAYKELMSNFSNVGGSKVIPAWVSKSPNGDVEVIVVSAGLEQLSGEEIEELQQKICPGTFIYEVSGTWKAGDTITVNGDTYTAIADGASEDYTFLIDWTDSAILGKLQKSFYNSKIVEDADGNFSLKCKTNYTVTVESAGGTIDKTCDLTGGTGTGLAPIGHNVQITAAKGRLVTVNFDLEQDNGFQTRGSIADMRNALIDVTQNFTNNWEDFSDTMPIYLSWYISALQQLPGFIAVVGLQFHLLGEEASSDMITLKRDEYPYFLPTNKDLRTIMSSLDDSGNWAESQSLNMKTKVLRDDGGTGQYTMYPYLERKERSVVSTSIGGYTFNWTQQGYCSFTNIEASKEFISFNDKNKFCSNDRTSGRGVLSLTLAGRCKDIFPTVENGMVVSPTVTELPFTISNVAEDNKYADTFSENKTVSDTLGGNIFLRFYLGTNARINSSVANKYKEYYAIWNAIRHEIEAYDEELRTQWLNEDDPDTPTLFDLNELGRRCKAASAECEFNGNCYLGFGPEMFLTSTNPAAIELGDIVSVDLEAKTATLPVYLPPVISMTLHHESEQDIQSEIYNNSYIWRN